MGDRISVGRTRNNDIVFPDASVSKLHAYFTREARGIAVKDMKTENGRVVLPDGKELTYGELAQTAASLDPPADSQTTLTTYSSIRLGRYYMLCTLEKA